MNFRLTGWEAENRYLGLLAPTKASSCRATKSRSSAGIPAARHQGDPHRTRHQHDRLPPRGQPELERATSSRSRWMATTASQTFRRLLRRSRLHRLRSMLNSCMMRGGITLDLHRRCEVRVHAAADRRWATRSTSPPIRVAVPADLAGFDPALFPYLADRATSKRQTLCSSPTPKA